MGNPQRSEMEVWLTKLDPDLRTAFEAEWDRQESLEKDFPERRAEAEHNERNLVTGAKGEAEANIKNTLSRDTPNGKLYYFKKDESSLKSFMEHYDHTMYLWQTLVKGYRDMIAYEKKIPSEKDIQAQINQASPSVGRDSRIAQVAQQGVKNAGATLNQCWFLMGAVKQDITFALRDLKNKKNSVKANELREEAEKFQAKLDIFTKTLKGAAEAEENPVAALGDVIEAIKAADDLMDDDSTLNRARALETKTRKDVSDLAADKFAAAQKSLDQLRDLYIKNHANLAAAAENLKNQSEAAERNFDQENKGGFHFRDLDSLLGKANLVKNWVDDFSSHTDDVTQDAKGAWLSDHPQREENQKTTDRMKILIENHRKDAQGFLKEAGSTFDKWKYIKRDAERTLSLQN